MILNRIGISQKLFSDGIWSVLGNVAHLFAGLVTVKIVTDLVESDAYGQANLVLGVITLMNGLIAGPLLTAHHRTFFDYRARNMEAWFVSHSRLFIGAAIALMCLIYLSVATIYFLLGTSIYLELVLPACLLVTAQTLLGTLTNYIEADRLQRKLASVNIFQRASAPLFLLVLLFLKLSQPYALVLSQSLVAVIALIIFRMPTQTRLMSSTLFSNKNEIIHLRRTMLGFSSTLVFSFGFMWIQTTSDRYIIGHFLSLKEVGVYAINYSFWSLPFLMLNASLETLTRPIIYAKAASSDWKSVKQLVFWRAVVGLACSVFGTVFLFFLARPISFLLIGDSYHVDISLIMLIAISHCFYVLGYSVVPVFLAAKQVKIVIFATAIAAAINITFNLITIPVYGIWGAGSTTLLSYVVWAFILLVSTYHFFGNPPNLLVDLEF